MSAVFRPAQQQSPSTLFFNRFQQPDLALNARDAIWGIRHISFHKD